MRRFLAWWAAIALLAPAARAAEAGTPRALESIYPGVQALRAATGAVVCLVDTEHPDEVRKTLRDRPPYHLSLERVRLCIELETAGLPCLLAHASMLSSNDLARPCVRAVAIGARSRRGSEADERRLHALIRGCPKPVLCLGGAQAILAEAWGGTTGVLRKLRPGEPDPDPSYMPGVLKETGFTTVRIVARDPIFDGFNGTFEVWQRHSSEVKELPPEFEVIASTDACRVQVCRHRERPQYGVQFVADRFDDRHPDGRRILRNFFASAGIDVERRVPEARAAYRARVRERVSKVCREPAGLRRQTAPFVAVVDMEHPEVVGSARRGSGTGMTHAEKIAQLCGRIGGEVAGLPCVVVHYAEATRADFAGPNLRAIVITGAGSPSVAPMLGDLLEVVREARVPILGICAGHQHVARAHGAASDMMRKLREGEKDPHPAYHPGMFKEWGMLPVKVVRRDPLFDGLPDTLTVQEYHAAEVKTLPGEFELLASTPDCRIEAIRRRDRPVYGIQFHAECYDEAHPDGLRVLQNFFRIAAEAQRPAASPASP